MLLMDGVWLRLFAPIAIIPLFADPSATVSLCMLPISRALCASAANCEPVSMLLSHSARARRLKS